MRELKTFVKHSNRYQVIASAPTAEKANAIANKRVETGKAIAIYHDLKSDKYLVGSRKFIVKSYRGVNYIVRDGVTYFPYQSFPTKKQAGDRAKTVRKVYKGQKIIVAKHRRLGKWVIWIEQK